MLPHFAAQDRRKKSRPAIDYVGIDLHKNSSQLCILTEDGELIERRIKTDRESFDKLFGERPPARILIEASTESEWCARHLEAGRSMPRSSTPPPRPGHLRPSCPARRARLELVT